MTVTTLLLVIALILFVLAAFNVSSKISLGWMGAACVVLSWLAPSIG